MSELIEAAKAVIEEWDTCMKHDGVCEGIESRFRAAVELAENQPADYNEWTARHSGQTVSPYELWTAAQQAERERIKQLILETHGLEAATLLRKIDDIR